MDVTLFNTLSRSLEKLEPLADREVRMYQCGPTVYWVQHIGNMRAMIISDVLVRTLAYSGYKVKFARNYTDVGHLTSDDDEGEDKMAKGVRREGLSPDEIAQKYIDTFEKDVRELNTLEPDFKPKATDHIPEMIEVVKTLIEKDFAYITPLAVYFDVSKAKDYTRLSGQILENNIEDAGRGTVSDPNKRNPADFSVWFFKAGAHENALQTWPNPFSDKEGFPGWHIECSAMIKKLLGDTIDIHMGGIEHIPVHHTNEIAQSESATNKPLARIWLHNEHLLVDGKKMSKSEGTSYSLKDVKEKGFNPLALRYLFLNAHYRSKQNFTWEALEGADIALRKLYIVPDEKIGTISSFYRNRFAEALSSDLNTPQALAVMWEMIKDHSISRPDKTATLLDFDRVFGLGIERKQVVIPSDVGVLVSQRNTARQNKDWAKSDQIREEINALGWDISDTDKGAEIQKKK